MKTALFPAGSRRLVSESSIRRLWKWLPGLLMAVGVASAQAQTVEYIHTDALGTPVAVTNSAGVVIERSEYEPYGKLLNRPLTDGPGFTGHVQDATTGLTYMQQRYYDPGIGRFLSVDPVAADGNTGGNFNRYKYASNNPYKFTDPDGRQDCMSCERSYGAAVGYMLRDNPEAMRVWAGGENAAGTAGSGAEQGAAMGQAACEFVDKGDYSGAAVAGAVGKAVIGAVLTGRGKNKIGPNSEAKGAHSSIKRDANGNTTNTATYEPNPKNPSGFQEVKRVDVTGAPHTNPDGTKVSTPHVSEPGTKA